MRKVVMACLAVAGMALAYVAGQNRTTGRSYDLSGKQSIIRSSVDEYYKKMDEARADFMSGEMPNFRRVPVPEGVPNKYNVQEALAIDLNDDGVDEIQNVWNCGAAVYCDDRVFRKTDSGYSEIMDAGIFRLGKKKDNYRNVFTLKRLPNSPISVRMLYEWNGQRYVYSGKFTPLEEKREASVGLKRAMKAEPSPERRLKIFEDMSAIMGYHDALELVLLSQMPSNIPLPEDRMEYERLIVQLTEDTGAEYRTTDPELLRERLFVSAASRLAFDRTDPFSWGIQGGISVINSVKKEFGQDPRSQYIRTLEKTDSRVAQYVKAAGNPSDQRLREIFIQGGSGVVRESEIRLPQRPRDSITSRSYDSGTGTTIESQTIYPNATPAQIEEIERRQSVQQRQQEIQRNFSEGVKRLPGDLNRGLQQGGDAIRQGIDNFLKQQEKK